MPSERHVTQLGGEASFVVGLSAAALEALGADVHRGSLEDLDRRRW
jgi:hypothetical protein